jgi:hypothetical protein
VSLTGDQQLHGAAASSGRGECSVGDARIVHCQQPGARLLYLQSRSSELRRPSCCARGSTPCCRKKLGGADQGGRSNSPSAAGANIIAGLGSLNSRAKTLAGCRCKLKHAGLLPHQSPSSTLPSCRHEAVRRVFVRWAPIKLCFRLHASHSHAPASHPVPLSSHCMYTTHAPVAAVPSTPPPHHHTTAQHSTAQHTHLQQLLPQPHHTSSRILRVAGRHIPERCCCSIHVLAACETPTGQEVVQAILHIAEVQVGVPTLQSSKGTAHSRKRCEDSCL